MLSGRLLLLALVAGAVLASPVAAQDPPARDAAEEALAEAQRLADGRGIRTGRELTRRPGAARAGARRPQPLGPPGGRRAARPAGRRGRRRPARRAVRHPGPDPAQLLGGTSACTGSTRPRTRRRSRTRTAARRPTSSTACAPRSSSPRRSRTAQLGWQAPNSDGTLRRRRPHRRLHQGAQPRPGAGALRLRHHRRAAERPQPRTGSWCSTTTTPPTSSPLRRRVHRARAGHRGARVQPRPAVRLRRRSPTTGCSSPRRRGPRRRSSRGSTTTTSTSRAGPTARSSRSPSPARAMYGSAIWNHWLEQRYGADVVREAWEGSDAVRRFAPGAYDDAIAATPAARASPELHGLRRRDRRVGRAPTAGSARATSSPASVGAADADADRRRRRHARAFTLDHTAFALFDVAEPTHRGPAAAHGIAAHARTGGRRGRRHRPRRRRRPAATR